MTTYKTRKSYTSRLAKLLCSVALLGLVSVKAHAGPIIGDLEYNGVVFPTPIPLSTTTHLDFLSPSTFALGNGALAPLTGAGTLDLFDFDINPFAGSTSSPVAVWAQLGVPGGFAFSLTSLVIEHQDDSFLALSGAGFFSAAGYDDTDAVWSLTMQDTGDPSPILTFSASSAVPEPEMLTLFGLALLGLSLTKRVRTRPVAS